MSAMMQSALIADGIRAFMSCAPWVVVEPLTVRGTDEKKPIAPNQWMSVVAR
jgi:hypothetical protein